MAWKEEDVKWLIENYPLVGKKASALKLNKTEGSIRGKASLLNLKQDRDSLFFKDWQERAAKSKVGKERPGHAKAMAEHYKNGKILSFEMTEDRRANISNKAKERIRVNGHPKGFRGKNHSKEVKNLISQSAIEMWSDPNSKVNQDEFRQNVSDRASMMHREGKLKGGYSRGKQGRREDLDNIFFRSSWEANYARYLNLLISQGQLYKWEFESETFWFEKIKRGVRSYLPDFKLWETKDSKPYYVEIKGWMDAKSKTKLNRMRIYYPDVRIDVVASKEYAEIKNKLSILIPGWE